MSDSIMEDRLNHPDPVRRRETLHALMEQVRGAALSLPAPGPYVNVHAHTTFSYNGYGYSPTCFAWKARQAGLLVAGIVDFDVLDGVAEFLDACAVAGLRGCAGIETRVFVAEFADAELNSPGEPGIAYMVGAGFIPGAGLGDPLLEELGRIARDRTRAITARVNSYLNPVTIDFERDVLALTPKGNATERHLCIAYDRAARMHFPDAAGRAAFWADRLGEPEDRIRAILDDSPALQALIRGKTMKSGGAGYIPAKGPDFPPIEKFNRFVMDAGAIPSYAFLDGTLPGEKDSERLLDIMTAHGAASITVVPERNWNLKDPDVKRVKVANLWRFVELAQVRGLPLFAGTEMNAYGQRFVDKFETPELRPLLPAFRQGALIQYAHTVLQMRGGMGYLSDWADRAFRSVDEKNAFFERIGEELVPPPELVCSPDMSPERVEQAAGKTGLSPRA